MVHGNLISDFPVILDDVTVANTIYGPNLHSIKGKKMRIKLMTVAMDYIYVPPEIIREHGDIMVAMDVMYINKTTSWRIRFISAEYVNDRSKGMLMELSKKIINLYSDQRRRPRSPCCF